MSLADCFDLAERTEMTTRHVILEHSIADVDAAGDLITDPPVFPDEDDAEAWNNANYENWQRVQRAYSIINNFRASHSFPLNTFQTTLRDKARRIDPSATVAQRVKRLPTIVEKLKRRKFKLSEIQDIGGCRAILSSVARVRALVETYKESDLKHKLLRPDDYISEPKVTGYRGVHLIYSYYSDRKNTYNGHKIEIQFRTNLQHAWATAVETVGIFTAQALKSNQGDRKWKRFFALMGSAIAMREKCPLVPNTPTDLGELVADIRRYADRLGVVDHLRLYNAALKYGENNIEGARYFLLQLEPKANRVLVTGFKSAELMAAQERYQEVERMISGAAGDDVVLVSTGSMDALRRAYPNYFLDTHVFANIVSQVIGN